MTPDEQELYAYCVSLHIERELALLIALAQLVPERYELAYTQLLDEALNLSAWYTETESDHDGKTVA